MSYVSPDQQANINALRTDQYEELERLEEAPLRQIAARCEGRDFASALHEIEARRLIKTLGVG